jgi:hypothetical protein
MSFSSLTGGKSDRMAGREKRLPGLSPYVSKHERSNELFVLEGRGSELVE